MKADDFRTAVEKGASDDEMVPWMNENASLKSPEQIKAFSDEVMTANPYQNPEKRDWFVEQVSVYNRDPKTTTLWIGSMWMNRESYKNVA